MRTTLLILDYQNGNRGHRFGISIRHNGPLAWEGARTYPAQCQPASKPWPDAGGLTHSLIVYPPPTCPPEALERANNCSGPGVIYAVPRMRRDATDS